MPDYRQLSFDHFEFQSPAPKPTPPSRREATIPSKEREITKPLADLLKIGGGKIADLKLIEDCRSWLLDLQMFELAEKVTVCWNRKLATTAGLAYHVDARIELNLQLLQFAPEEPLRTLKHELAHLIAHHRAGKRRIQPHGREWQRACVELGIPGEDRCHTLPFARRQVSKRFAYKCKNCGIVVPRVRPLARDSACYPCCKKFNGGAFNRNFQLQRITLKEARNHSPDIPWAG